VSKTENEIDDFVASNALFDLEIACRDTAGTEQLHETLRSRTNRCSPDFR
jgi:hypothetical protein